MSSALVCECVRPFSRTHACISGIPTVTDPSDIVRYVSVVLREYVCYAQVTQVMFPCVETSVVSRVWRPIPRASVPLFHLRFLPLNRRRRAACIVRDENRKGFIFVIATGME